MHDEPLDHDHHPRVPAGGPDDDAPVENVPVENVPVENVPVENVPVENVPVENVTADDVPASDGPAGDVPAGEAPSAPTGFAALGLDRALLGELMDLGYEEPTPIQTAAIPPVLEGRDVLGQAATGTGKTAAFALPILQHLEESGGTARPEQPSAMILVPTRELAMQISEAVHRYGRAMGAKVVPIYGGQPIHRQLSALRRGADVVVATPGRAIDHLSRGTLSLDGVRTIVLDEADEMLDMGFAEDLEQILDATPPEHQTVLFSATLPHRIARLADAHMNDPVRIEIAPDRSEAAASPLVRQAAYVVPRSHKAAALGRVLDVESPTAALVFCRTRVEVDQLTETLNGRGYRAEALHGGMNQHERDRVMGRLRSGTAELLIATDVAARGLDVDTLTHVVNYDLPSSQDTFVHRVGRVGRAGRAGVAITLVEPRQRRLLKSIARDTGIRIPVERVPSVADLRSRRLEVLAETLRERMAADTDGSAYAEMLAVLLEDNDLIDVATAALGLLDELTQRTGGDEDEIPEVRDEPRDRGRRDREGPGRRKDFGDRSGRDGRSERRGPARGATRLFVNAGREDGVRPGDLVGAITGETDLRGSDIGAIDITNRFSLVEVPDDAVDRVIRGMRGATIRGRKVNVRRERFDGGSGGYRGQRGGPQRADTWRDEGGYRGRPRRSDDRDRRSDDRDRRGEGRDRRRDRFDDRGRD